MAITKPGKLWLTADGGRLVADGDADAATLYCGPDDGVDSDDLAAFGWKSRPVASETKEIVGAADKNVADDDAGGEDDEKPARRRGARK